MATRGRTQQSREKIQKLQERYETWMLGRVVRGSLMINGIPTAGQSVVRVEWIGNSVYGAVNVVLHNGTEFPIGGRGYMPNREEVERHLEPVAPRCEDSITSCMNGDANCHSDRNNRLSEKKEQAACEKHIAKILFRTGNKVCDGCPYNSNHV